MTKLIPLDYYLNAVEDTTQYQDLLTLGVSEQWKWRSWIPELPKDWIATGNLILFSSSLVLQYRYYLSEYSDLNVDEEYAEF